jgi:hypothetical protein
VVRVWDSHGVRNEFTFQVSASAEGPSFAGQNANAEAGLFVHPLPYFVQIGMALRIDAVEVAWSVECDEEDVRCRKGEEGVLRVWGRCCEPGHCEDLDGDKINVS